MKKKSEGYFKKMLFAVLALTMAVLVSTGTETVKAASVKYTVKVDSGYLALRDAETYDASNEIGKLYNGDVVYYIMDGNTSDYWYVLADTLNARGYVNKNYLKEVYSNSATVYSDNSEGGISTWLICDMDDLKFSTAYIHFDIPDSWSSGIWLEYDEEKISFYCKPVKLAEGLEDGYLCSIIMSETGRPEGNVQDISTGNLKYNYYLVTPSDVRANPDDTANYEIYQDMLEDAVSLAGKVKVY